MQNETIQARSTLRFPILLLWIAGTTVGWALGIVPLIMAMNGVFWNGTDTNPSPLGTACYILFIFLLFALLSGYAVAITQAHLLSETLKSRADKWVIRTTIAICLGWTVGWLGSAWPLASLAANKLVSWLVSGVIMGITVGLFVGITQTRTLRLIYSRVGWWALSSVSGWATAFVLYWLVYWIAGGSFETVTTSYYDGGIWPKTVEAPGSWPAMLAGWIVGGLALGIITGIAMKMLTNDTANSPATMEKQECS